MLVNGSVVHGKGEGRRLGYPTANIELTEKIPSGVYSGLVEFDRKTYFGAIFIHNEQKILEAHLLNFDGDLYGKTLNVQIKQKIRENIPYQDDVQMRIQIKSDIDRVKSAS